MIRDIIKDETFLSLPSVPAAPDDLPVARDLLDTLTAHKDGCRDLYKSWGGRLDRQLAEETDLVLNLASKEYGRGSGAASAQGRPVCHMHVWGVEGWEGHQEGHAVQDGPGEFDQLGYRIREELSGVDRVVFLKEVGKGG